MLIHTVAHPGQPGPLPTLVALHGYGANAHDLLGLSPSLADGRLLMLCPQAPHDIEAGYFGFSWSGAPPGSGVSAPGIARAAEEVRRFIDEACEVYPIDRERVALLGFSQGGMVASVVGLAMPERLAGLALLSTRTAERSVGTLTATAEAARLPVLIQHGAMDAQISVEEGRASAERLRALGLEPRYEEYEMGHEINARSALDLSDWLEQVLRLQA